MLSVLFTVVTMRVQSDIKACISVLCGGDVEAGMNTVCLSVCWKSFAHSTCRSVYCCQFNLY
jgi:hypothetical protein